MKNVIKLIVESYITFKEDIKSVFRTVSDLGVYSNAWVSKSNDNNIVIGLKSVLDDSEFDKLLELFENKDISLKRADLTNKQTQRALDSMDKIEDMLYISNPASIDDLLNI